MVHMEKSSYAVGISYQAVDMAVDALVIMVQME